MDAQQRYSKVAMALHWLIALALAGEIALGFAMPRDASGFAAFQLHKSIGITVLLLTLVRLGWRFTHRPPAAVEAGWQAGLAALVHWLFYFFMVAMPLTGWALVSSAPIDVPTLLYGTVTWPHLPLGEGWNELAEESHELLAWFGISLFVLHVAGALRHHLLLKDGLLARMSPDRGGFALGMLVLSLLLGAGVYFGLGGGARDHADHDHGDAAAEQVAAVEPTPEASEAAVGEELAAEAEEVAEEEAEAPAAAGPPPAWTIQPGGSLRFSVDNAGSAMNGSFARWNGDIAMDPEAPESAAITIRVEIASATLGDATQDEMLRGPDFLAAAANPTAIWRSTSVRRVSGNRYEADGTLSLRGASRPQRIAFTLSGSGNQRQVEGSATIDRNAFGVGTGESAAGLAGQVRLTFAFAATR